MSAYTYLHVIVVRSWNGHKQVTSVFSFKLYLFCVEIYIEMILLQQLQLFNMGICSDFVSDLSQFVKDLRGQFDYFT